MAATTVRRNIKDRLVELVHAHDAFLAETAWISDREVLDAMRGKCLGLITQNRPISARIMAQYARILCPLPVQTIEGVHGATHALGDVRLDGTFHSWSGGFSGGGPHSFMHRKVLIFGDLEARSPYFAGGTGPEHWVFRPRVLWTGSYNITHAARRHREHVVYVEDPALARAEAAEFWHAYTGLDTVLITRAA